MANNNNGKQFQPEFLIKRIDGYYDETKIFKTISVHNLDLKLLNNKSKMNLKNLEQLLM